MNARWVFSETHEAEQGTCTQVTIPQREPEDGTELLGGHQIVLADTHSGRYGWRSEGYARMPDGKIVSQEDPGWHLTSKARMAGLVESGHGTAIAPTVEDQTWKWLPMAKTSTRTGDIKIKAQLEPQQLSQQNQGTLSRTKGVPSPQVQSKYPALSSESVAAKSQRTSPKLNLRSLL